MVLKSIQIALILALAAQGCKPGPPERWEPDLPQPEGLLSEEQMIAVLVDVHLAEGDALEKSLVFEEQRDLLKGHYSRICGLHGISFEQFCDSYDYYVQKPLTMQGMYQRVVEELTRMQGELESG